MKPTADLFNLIKSLDKNEKRYVALFLASGVYKNNKNSLELFKAISKQKKFDEEAIKKQFAKSFSKRLSAEKSKLFDLVLESMIFLYRDSMPERRVNRNRLRSWFLFQKGLRPLGWKYFDKAKAIAEQYEFFPHLLAMAYIENHETRLSNAGDLLFTKGKYHKRDQDILQAINNDLILHTLFTELIELQKQTGTNKKSIEARIGQIISHPLVRSKKLTVFSSTMSRLDILGIYHAIKNNYRQACICFGEQAEAIEKAKIPIDQNYTRYLNALSNQLMHAALSRQYDMIPPLAQKLKKVSDKIRDYFSYDTSYNDFVGIHLYELVSWKNQADAKAGQALLTRLEKDFYQYRPVMRDTLVIGFLFLFGTYHFYLGNLKKALHYFNDFVDSTDPATGENFQCMARMVKLLLHYDLGHYDLLPSLTQSTMRLLKKNDWYGSFEKELLLFCQRSAEGENKTALNLFYAATKKHAPAQYGYGAWSDFDFNAWAESHLKNKLFAVLISSKEEKAAGNK
ncbi:MAG: hypothetical protein ABIQ40_02180 [Bacteroidia bacterium]